MARYGRDFQDYDRGRGRMRGDASDMGSQYGGYGRGAGYGDDYDADYGFDGYSGGMGGYNTGRGYAGGGGSSGGGYGGQRGGYGYGGGGGGQSGGYGRYADTSDGYGQSGRGGQTSRMRAADIMTENPETVTGEATLAEAAKRMRDLNVGIIPVVDSEEGRRLQGVITDRDIAIRAVADGMDANDTKVQDVMTSDVETCNKNDSVQQVLQVMQREQVRRVPITDREGRLVGIIAQADVATDLDSHGGEHMVADTVERISEPGRPQGGGRQSGKNRGR